VVLERVQAMFANEPDLIEGFGQFVANLPDAAQ
jgi:histone deacetylase complex regulatory component SIN3